MTDYIAAIVLAVGFALVMRVVGFGSLDRFSAGLSQLVGGWRPDAWPHGVQEEDPDRPWGRSTKAVDRGSGKAAEEDLPAPRLAAVRAMVRPR